MKKILFPSAVLLLGAALPGTASAAFTKGGSAYTKRVETLSGKDTVSIRAPVKRATSSGVS